MEGKKKCSMNEFGKPIRNISELTHDGVSDLTPSCPGFVTLRKKSNFSSILKDKAKNYS